MVGAQNVSKDHGVNLCTIKTIRDNIIGSNTSSGKLWCTWFLLYVYQSKYQLGFKLN